MKMRRKTGIWAIVLVLLTVFAVLLSGCGSSDVQPPEPDSESSDIPEDSDKEDAAPEMTPEEKIAMSERAMQNFLDKLSGGNYVMNAEGYMKTTAYSEDLVVFDYEDDSAYSDFAVMSVNNEVFQGFFEGDGVADAAYLTEGRAIDAAISRLPGYWMADEVSEGNIYNVFYNDPDEPLRFVSYDAGVQSQVCSFAGYGSVAMNYMHEVYLTLDQEDPTVAHIQAVVDDDEVARYYFDDIDVTVTFGSAEPDPRAEAWMKAPAYPEARTEWTEADTFIFNSVFLPGYGEQAIPFMPFASYALSIDGERFLTDDAVYIRDPHATQADIESYIETLRQNGFEEAEGDGGACYRRLLREETNCYSSITLDYADGLNAVAGKYYDYPKYEGLDEINEFIAGKGYPELAETADLTGFAAFDAKDEQTESWLYFYNYDTVLYVSARYADYDAVTAYLDGCAADVTEAGFEPVYVDGDDGEVDHYRSSDGSMTFRYHFEDDGETVTLLYKAEKLLAPSEVQTILAGEGFPEIDLSASDGGRDHTKFQKVMYGKDYDAAISLSMAFDTVEEAEAFLDQYVADLEEDGFMRVPASVMSSNKNNGYANEETGLGVAFDFFPGEDGGETSIYFEFKSGIDFESGEPEEGEGPILGVAFDIVEDAGGVKRLSALDSKTGL